MLRINRFIGFFVLFVLTAGFFTLATILTTEAQEARPSRMGIEDIPHLPNSENQGDELSYSIQNMENFLPWSKIAVQSYRDGNWNIYVGVDGANTQTRLTGGNTSEIQPHLNRGNTQIVFAQKDVDYEIVKMDINGSNPIVLTANNADDGNPIWSPDGIKIVFESYRDGQAEVYVMNADGSNQKRLTAHGDFDGMPTWSPDGAKIAFVSRRAGGYHIWVMNADGTNKVQLSTQPYSFRPQWSPDGNQIAFDADGDRDGWQDLWLMNADGSNQHQIYSPSRGTTDVWAGSWSPDGKYIAFTYIHFIQYQGNWYWEWANLSKWDIERGIDEPLIYTTTYRDTDWTPRWQTSDIIKPQSLVSDLQEYTFANNFKLTWSGQEGLYESSIKNYDVQYRLGESGDWINWKMGTTDTYSDFPVIFGETIYFRSRARDNAYNVGEWKETRTNFYEWRMSGRISNNRGASLDQVDISIVPSPLDSAVSDKNGRFTAWLVSDEPHAVNIARNYYEPISETDLHMERIEQVALAPADNIIQNGAFEKEQQPFENWVLGGNLPISQETDFRHTGANGLLLGESCAFPCLSPAENLTWATYANANLVVDSLGTLHVVWRDELGRPYPINYISRTTDGNWSDVYKLTDWGGLPISVIDNDDTLHVTWSTSGDIYHQRRLLTGEWTSPEVVATGEIYHKNTLIDDNGTLHILATSYTPYYDNTIAHLIHLEKRVNSLWTTEEVARTSEGVMALGPDGALHFAWGNRSYRVKKPDGTWTEIETIPHDHSGVTRLHHIIVDNNDIIHVFLTHPYLVSDKMMYHTYRLPNGIWSPAIALPQYRESEYDNSFQMRQSVASDSQGNIHLINRPDDSLGWIYYRMWSLETGWTEPVLLNPERSRERPSLTLDKYDTLHLIWSNASWFLGDEYGLRYQSSEHASFDGTAQISQQVYIPDTMENPTLSFMQRGFKDTLTTASGFELSVTEGLTNTVILTGSKQADWSHVWTDMSPWVGENITVTFKLNQQAGEPLTSIAIDDISLGSSYPDIWVDVSSINNALPGDIVNFELVYGNQSSISASDAVITATLPAELIFESASVLPISLSPLVWEVNTLLPEGFAEPIVITTTVSSSAPLMKYASTLFEIQTTSSEIELLNNKTEINIFLSLNTFLPIIKRE